MLSNLHRHCNTGLPDAHPGSTQFSLESGLEKVDKGLSFCQLKFQNPISILCADY